MKRRMLVLALAAVLCLALAACGSSAADTETTAAAETEEETVAAVEETTEAETEPETETEEETEEETTEAAEEEEAGELQAASGDWVNFDDMCFYINGKKYVLGQTTLQDMIDDGVPFNETDLEDAGNNIKSNYQSGYFRIVLGDYYNAEVFVLNDTEEGKPASECYVNEVYLPVHSGEEQDVLSFDFPLDIAKEDLEANVGEPDDTYYNDNDENYIYDTYTYTQESTVYYRGSSYKFEFTNNELKYVTLEYMP